MISSLQDILDPDDLAALKVALRERRRIHIRSGKAELFKRILPWSSFNSLLSSGRLLDERTRLARRGRNLPQEMWSYVDRDFQRIPLPNQVQRLCHEGLSLIVNQINLSVPAIAAVNAMLERTFGACTHTNLYASFGRESAFRAHRDTHDVFVLHLHGRKRWFCYGYLEQVKTKQVPEEALGDVEWEGVLEPGDILYVPRGDVHCASVEAEASLHLTTTFWWPRGTDLLKWLARTGRVGEIDFDPDIPVYGTPEDMQRYERDLRLALHRLADTLDLRTFLDAFNQERKPHPPLNLGLSSSLEPDTFVQAVPRQDIPLPPEGPADFIFYDQKVTLDASERAVLSVLLAQGGHRVADLPAVTDLDMATVRAAVSGLARQSLVLLTEG